MISEAPSYSVILLFQPDQDCKRLIGMQFFEIQRRRKLTLGKISIWEGTMGTRQTIPAAQYLRMSTEQQHYSLENQAICIQRYAASKGFEIVQTYFDPGKSGLSLRHRSGLRQLLKDVVDGSAQYLAVLVYDVSRWGRFQDSDEAAHYEFLCKSAGVPIHYCAETFPNDGSIGEPYRMFYLNSYIMPTLQIHATTVSGFDGRDRDDAQSIQHRRREGDITLYTATCIFLLLLRMQSKIFSLALETELDAWEKEMEPWEAQLKAASPVLLPGEPASG